jgi:hypothetical protein
MADGSFTSDKPFSPGPPDALGVCCSDGRFASQCVRFADEGLGIDCCDWVMIPGGPACLGDHAAAADLRLEAVKQIEFLVRAHGVERIILIAHEDCGYYRQTLGLVGPSQRRRQHDDIARAVERLDETLGPIDIDAYEARVANSRVTFHPIDPHQHLPTTPDDPLE